MVHTIPLMILAGKRPNTLVLADFNTWIRTFTVPVNFAVGGNTMPAGVHIQCWNFHCAAREHSHIC